MLTDEMRKKIDEQCISWVECQKAIEKKGIKKDQKSEHKYRFQNFLSESWPMPIMWLDEKALNSIWPRKGEKCDI